MPGIRDERRTRDRASRDHASRYNCPGSCRRAAGVGCRAAAEGGERGGSWRVRRDDGSWRETRGLLYWLAVLLLSCYLGFAYCPFCLLVSHVRVCVLLCAFVACFYAHCDHVRVRCYALHGFVKGSTLCSCMCHTCTHIHMYAHVHISTCILCSKMCHTCTHIHMYACTHIHMYSLLKNVSYL